jgi:hypothetical protein
MYGPVYLTVRARMYRASLMTLSVGQFYRTVRVTNLSACRLTGQTASTYSYDKQNGRNMGGCDMRKLCECDDARLLLQQEQEGFRPRIPIENQDHLFDLRNRNTSDTIFVCIILAIET